MDWGQWGQRHAGPTAQWSAAKVFNRGVCRQVTPSSLKANSNTYECHTFSAAFLTPIYKWLLWQDRVK